MIGAPTRYGVFPIQRILESPPSTVCTGDRKLKMIRLHSSTIYVVWLLTVGAQLGLTVHAKEPADAGDDRQAQLIDVLQSDAPPQIKAITCKKLAIYGTADAVPDLEKLLHNPQLASWARIALEAIPDPAADEALRNAVRQLDGRLLIGAVNSVGVRRDPHAVELLTRKIRHHDAEVASAAAVALGRIGNLQAAEALQQSLATTPADVRSAVAEGCIRAAERLLAEGKTRQAVQLYDKVRAAEVPQQRVLEAIRGAILARQQDGIPLLVEQLHAPDPRQFKMGLMVARELSAPEVTEALTAQLPQVKPVRQPLLIRALADRNDAAAVPTVLAAARSGPDPVRIVAIQVLRRIGNVSCIPVLLEIAVEDNAELAQAALDTLAGLPGEDVDVQLVIRLAAAKGKMRKALFELAGSRRITLATPALIGAMSNSDPEIRLAALTALGSTIGPEDLSVLIVQVVTPSESQESDVALQALHAACIRMPDRETCAAQLTAAMPRAPVPVRCAMLETLADMGGETALTTVSQAAGETNPQLQDTATRVLGRWMSADAAPVLLELARSTPENKFQKRALRGYIRILRQFDFSDHERAAMCRHALELANRDAEKTLVFKVLQRYPSRATIEVAVQAANAAETNTDAVETALMIAHKIGTRSPEVQNLLAQIGHAPANIQIIDATYGTPDQAIDVTATLRKHVGDLRLIVLPSPSYNASFGRDPAPQAQKQLKIKYSLNDKVGEAAFPENAVVVLPIPEESS